jgi:hypothetical protein
MNYSRTHQEFPKLSENEQIISASFDNLAYRMNVIKNNKNNSARLVECTTFNCEDMSIK